MSRMSYVAPALSLAGLIAFSYAHAVQRSFVASYGNDSNTAANCTFSTPCRSFTAAQTVTDSGGEIVALDAAGYGAITITKSISIVANPGFYAGIAASTGTAVTISTPGLSVLLRGLTINGTGATTGIMQDGGGTLIVENCVISNFTGDGLSASGLPGFATVRVVNTTVRGNGQNGAHFMGGIGAEVSGSKFLNNTDAGVRVAPPPGTPAFVSVSDSISSGNALGYVSSQFSARMNVVRSTASDNATAGVQAEMSGVISAAYTNVSGNGIGLNGVSGPVETMGNNWVRGNGTNTSGNILVLSGS
jgi:hypothetical protein